VGRSESREVLKVADPSIFMECGCHVVFLFSRLGEEERGDVLWSISLQRTLMPETCFGAIAYGYGGASSKKKFIRLVAGNLRPYPSLFR
jgi:hypothetical protein